MDQQEYILREDDYRVWLALQDPEQVIGYCQSSHLCAIAQYLKAAYRQQFHVDLGVEITHSLYGPIGARRSLHLPIWAQKEASIFDTFGAYGEAITKQRYDFLMALHR
jgi:hypothetical protein